MFIGRDWIVIARIKFRQTGRNCGFGRRFCGFFGRFRPVGGAAIIVCLNGAGSGRRPGGMQSPGWSKAPGGSPCEASPEAVRAVGRPRLPTAAGRRQSADLRLPLRSSARHRSPRRRRAPRCSARGRSAVFRCPRPELRKKIQRPPPLAIRACACSKQRARRPLATGDRRRGERRVAASTRKCWTTTFVPANHSLSAACAGLKQIMAIFAIDAS